MLKLPFSGSSSLRNSLAAATLAAMLAGCATPYQDAGLMGGVKVSQLDPNTLNIAGRGNAFTSADTVENYVMLRAAQETVRRGYDMFLVVDGNVENKAGVVTINGQPSATSTSANAYGKTTTTYYSPGTAIRYVKPQSDITIQMIKGEKPADAPRNLFVAVEVIKFLGPKVER